MEDRRRQENKRKTSAFSLFTKTDGIAFFVIKLEVMITDQFSKCQMLTNKYCRVKLYVMGIKGSRKEDENEDDLGCGG